MKAFSRMCLCIFVIVFFIGIFLLQGKFALATTMKGQGLRLPKPDEMVLASEKDIPRHIWMAGQYLKAGKFKSVVSICKQVLDLKADQVDARACMAAAYKGMGNEKKFKQEIGLIKKQAPESPALYLALAQVYISRKDFKNAESTYKNGLKTAYEKTELHMDLATLYVQKGRLKEASTQYLEVLKTKNIAAKHFLNANFALCRIELLQKDYDGVIKRAGMVTDLYPPIPQGYLLLANAYLGKGETDQVINVYKKLIEANPKTPVPYQELALVYNDKLKDYQHALSYAEKAVQQFPEDPKSQDVLGWVYYHKEQYAEANKVFQEAVRLAPNNPQYHYHRGLAYQKMGEKIQAKKAFEQALKLLGPNVDNKFAKEIRREIDLCK